MNTRTKIKGGEAVYKILCANEINTVFGLLGGSMLELYDSIYRYGKINYIGARDERAAGHMADAYARITGGPGVVLGAQAGPGVVNLVTAVAEAQLAYSPLVVIAGAISRGDLGKDTFQEVDQVALFAPVCKRSILVTEAQRLAPMLQDAIRLAMSGRRGPVVLHVPRDLFAAMVSPPDEIPVDIAHAGAPSSSDIKKILAELNQSQAPVIVVGGGVKWSHGSSALVELVDQLQIPVVTSTGHADVMPHEHPLNAGQSGPRGNWVASRLTREADLLLVLGARLGFNSTFHSHDYISASAKIVQIDVEASAIGRYFPVALGVQGDARETIESLLNMCRSCSIDNTQWSDWLNTFKKDKESLKLERRNEGENQAIPLHPQKALAEIREVLPENNIVTLDTGNTCLQAADRLAHYRCPSLITPLDFGLVGFAYAAALGAKVAAPDQNVVCIMGDGGFGYTMSEITTAVQYNLNVIAIVLDNGAWGAEKAYQSEFFGGRLLGADIENPSYDEVAKLCGAEGFHVEKPGELATVLQQALVLHKPVVIHVKIDPNALSTLRKDLFKPSVQA